MRFPIFQYNNERNYLKYFRASGNSESYEILSCIKKETLEILKNANTYYQKIPQHFLNLTGKSLGSYQKCMVHYAKKIDPHKFHRETLLYQQDQNKLKFQKWRKIQQEFLNRHSSWQYIINKTEKLADKSQLLRLKQNWFAGQSLSDFSNEALLEVQQTILPIFENYLELAKTELNQHQKKLSSSFKIKLKNYLTLLKKEIDIEKQRLCETMLLRLQIISKENLPYYDDLILYFTLQLANMGVNYPIPDTPHYVSHRLNEKAFFRFHQFIMQHGKPIHIKKLFLCCWLKTTSNFAIKRTKSKLLIIPQQFKVFVKTASWHRFSPTRNYGEFILGQNFTLLSYFRLLENLPPQGFKLHDFKTQMNWQFLTNLSDTLINQYNTIRKNMAYNFIARLLFRHKLIILKEWQHYLQNNHYKIFCKKIDYAISVSEQIKTRLIFNLDKSLLQSKFFKEDLCVLVSSIQNDISLLSLDEKNLKTWQECLEVFDKIILNNNPGKSQNLNSPNIIHTNQEALQENPSSNIQMPASSNLISLTQDNKDEEHCIEKEIEEIMSQLITCYSSKNSNLSILVNRLNNAIKQIPLENIFKIKKASKSFASKIFINYLQEMISCETFEQSFNFHNSFQPHLLFENLTHSHIRKRFVELRKIHNPEDWIIFKAKCHSNLASLDKRQNTTPLVENFVQSLSQINSESSDTLIKNAKPLANHQAKKVRFLNA